jgi:hypothetical protein
MPELPPGVREYNKSPVIDQDNMPAEMPMLQVNLQPNLAKFQPTTSLPGFSSFSCFLFPRIPGKS